MRRPMGNRHPEREIEMASAIQPTLKTAAGTAGFLIMFSAFSASANDWNLTLGAGIGAGPDYEGANEYNLVPILVARASLGDQSLELRGTSLRATLLKAGRFSIGPVVNYRFARNDVDEDAVDDLEDIDAAVEVGGFVNYFNRGVIAGLTATHDVSGTHDGFLVSGQLGFRAQVLPLLASTVTVSSTYANGDFMDTYFGIGAGDSVASGLDAFDADAGFKDVGVALNLQHGRREGWGLTGILSYKRLLDDAADSPIVDDVGDANQLFGGAALTYSF